MISIRASLKTSFHFKFQGLVKDADTLQGIANALIHVRNITRIAKSFRRSDDINHDITSVHDGNYKQNANTIFIAYHPTYDFWNIKFERSSSKNCIFNLQKSISKLIFADYIGRKNPVQNKLKIQFIKFDFSNLISQKSSTDG